MVTPEVKEVRMRVGSRENEAPRPMPRRGGKLAVGIAATGLLLTSCGVEGAPIEEIPTSVVPTTETVDPTRISPNQDAEPAPTTTRPRAVDFKVCFGAFVDYRYGLLTVNPLVDSETSFPLLVSRKDDGSLQINRRHPYKLDSYDWLDSRGTNLGDAPPPDCKDVPVHYAQVVEVESDRPGSTSVLADPDISNGDFVSAADPGLAEASKLYNVTFSFNGEEGLRELQRSMTAPS